MLGQWEEKNSQKALMDAPAGQHDAVHTNISNFEQKGFDKPGHEPFGQSHAPPPFPDDLMNIPTEAPLKVYGEGVPLNGAAQKPPTLSTSKVHLPETVRTPARVEPQMSPRDLPAVPPEPPATNALPSSSISVPVSVVEPLPIPATRQVSRSPRVEPSAMQPSEPMVSQTSLPPQRQISSRNLSPPPSGTDIIHTRSFGHEGVPAIDAAGKPTPLCPSLVLPTSESRFAVALYELARAGADSTLHVVSLSGKALLSLKIRDSSRIEVSLAMQGDRPRCSIHVPEDEGPFTICGQNESPYGTFSATAHNIHEVTVQGQAVYSVEGNSKTLKFSVTTPKGEPVALARVNNTDYPGGDHFELRTLPGTDTVLVTAVVMAVVLFTSPD